MRSLGLVDLVDRNDKPIDGLVSVRTPESAESPHERAVLLEAAAFKPVDYVFFRRFKGADGKHIRSSQIAAYVIDNSNSGWGEDELAKWHQELWLHGGAPLIYVAWPTRVDILSCARRPDFWQVTSKGGVARYKAAERIDDPSVATPPHLLGKQALAAAAEVAGALRQRFSAYRLAEGTFWDDPANQKLAKADAAAHGSLIQAITEADNRLKGDKHPLRRRLLVLTVLIKYLEDRGVFPLGLFGRFHAGARSFLEILREGTVDEVKRLLRYLESKFNGDVFSLGPEASELTSTELNRFAGLIEAKQLGGQKHFWQLFSFEHIPVEVISRIYQRFVTGHGTGEVYTPPLLASLLLDQVMPYDRMTGDEKVLDPACGSGVFLVGAFKRLVTFWRSRHNWRKPKAGRLKRILADSIHGVEVEPAAVDLTAFSLALALCDALEPPVIWNSLKFDKLRDRNLRQGDYFEPSTFGDEGGHTWPKQFDVVVGNPPFQSKLTAAAKAVDNARSSGLPKLPDRQAAYLFLESGLRALRPGGALCLIQPHGLLYNSQTTAFRRYLMGICRLHTILDFVSVRGLYEGADPKTIAWHAVEGTARTRPVSHLTFRRTFSTAQRMAFEIDHYDWHQIPSLEAIDDAAIWRSNLLGGGRLIELSARLRAMKQLKDAVEERSWIYSEGFNVGSGGKPCGYLTDQPYLPTSALTDDGVDRSQIATLTDTHFEAPRTKELYDPPLVLIRENESLPVGFWSESNLTYRHSIVGIHAPRRERAALLDFYRVIQGRRRLYQFCLLLIGARTITGKATAVNKQDIDRLPFPANSSDLDLSFWEDALREDVLRHIADYVRLGQKSPLLRRPAAPVELEEYATLFVRLLGSLYRDLKRDAPLHLDGLIAQPFYFGPRPDVSWLGSNSEESLRKLIYDQSRDSLLTVRVVRYYEGNVILIVKPDRLRYWIPSTAIRDADDTLADLRRQGW